MAKRSNTVANLAQRIHQERQARKAHQHTATGETRGQVYEACKCGAVRTLDRTTGQYDAWHACDLCTSNHEPGDTGSPELLGEADTEWGHRIDAERVTLQFSVRSTRKLDTGKLPIDESPLFGGRRQQSLFDDGGTGR